MTNVKLKLMFLLLNALLTADIGVARSIVRRDVNNTDIVINFNSNSTFLPVDSNADTLRVAEDPDHQTESSAETNKNSKNVMEDIIDAEQDRDDHLSEKVMKDGKDDTSDGTQNSNSNTHMENIMNAEGDRDKHINMKVMGDHANDHQDDKQTNKHLEQILNSEQDRDSDLSDKYTPTQAKNLGQEKDDSRRKSPLLEKFIDAERDRDDSFTDIHSKSDMPKIQFLIAGSANHSEIIDKSVVEKSGKDVNGLDIDARYSNSSDVKRVDYVELTEVFKMDNGGNNSAYNLANITGHEVDNDLAPDTSFSDMQTLFMACFATLLPLLAVLFATLFIRCLCRKLCPFWCKRPTESESESSDKDEDNAQLKSPLEDGMSVDDEGAHSNGSIFTMTLKNNHLIVETEERNDIAKNGRETKMKYSPDNEGMFVVEVQQATAYRPTVKPAANHSPLLDPQISINQALIHRVAEEDSERSTNQSSTNTQQIEKDRALALSSTGLSISDLSMSSIGSQHASYSYGSQFGYEQGPFGYPIYSGYDIKTTELMTDSSNEPLISKTPTDPDKPVVTAAIFKQDSIIGSDAFQGPGYCIEGSTDGPLMSDVQAREVSLQHLHDQREKKIENGVSPANKIGSPKKGLTRADSLPVTSDDNKVIIVVKDSSVMETIKENTNINDCDEVSQDILKVKNTSLPVIKTEVFETVKEVIMSTGSPKFEQLNNDSSPVGDNTLDQPPLITITEELDAGTNDV